MTFFNTEVNNGSLNLVETLPNGKRMRYFTSLFQSKHERRMWHLASLTGEHYAHFEMAVGRLFHNVARGHYGAKTLLKVDKLLSKVHDGVDGACKFCELQSCLQVLRHHLSN